MKTERSNVEFPLWRKMVDRSLSASRAIMPGALKYQLEERETDLIGAFYKQGGEPPRFQYGGGVG